MNLVDENNNINDAIQPTKMIDIQFIMITHQLTNKICIF